MKAIDLFSGAGGLSLGFELAGIEVVAAVEFCEKAMVTYRHNFPNHLTYCDDIKNLSTKVMLKDLKNRGIKKSDIDLVIGGPPCPGFSNIGRSKIISLLRDGDWKFKGRPPKEFKHQFIQDPRNKLFLEFVRFVKEFQPKGFVMENVPGMLTSKNSTGKAITALINQSFKDIGYDCKMDVLDASDFGVPQARKRVIFIGWQSNKPFHIFAHPKPMQDKKWTSLDAISDLPIISQEGGLPVDNYTHPKNEYQEIMQFRAYKEAKRIDVRTGKVPSKSVPSKLSCHVGRWVNPRDRAIFPLLQSPENEPRTTYDMIEPSQLKFPEGWTWNGSKQVVTNGKRGKDMKTYKWYNRTSFKDKMRRIPWHKPSPTLVAHMATDTYMYIHPEPETHRTITPQEAARIQSFPDSFDFGEVSFTSQYRQIGNAVPPLMAKAIAEEIKNSWNF
ncbi:MAG: DNA cytosine methyltransferase [archaeon]|nr:DNA cytosine methyltransferase [archaeon]MDA0843063.1 DNA cytosine methyltransferase [archaeon]